MKKTLGWFFAATLLIGYSAVTVATSTYIESSVVDAGVDNSGNVFVDLVDVIPESGCSNAELIILSGESYKSTVLTLALTAKTTGARIRVKTNGCNGTVPIISTTGAQGYFIVK